MSKNIFLEDVAYGIYDRPGPTGKVAEEEFEATTVPDDVPVEPVQQMSNQLAVQRPPIEDEKYVPASIEELGRAASALAQLVPTSTIEFYYRGLHKLLDAATDKQNEIKNKEQEQEDEGTMPTVREESIRRKIREILVEQYDPREEEFDEYRGYSVIEPDNEPAQDEQKSGEMSLDDLAKEFGYSGAPGIRQEIDRLTNRLQYFATKIKNEDLEALVKYAVGEYIDTLDESGLLDEEDIEELRAAPSVVRDLDSFRYFFISSLVLPAYRQVVKDATKNVKTEISQLGVPKELEQTVFNQVTGAASRKPAVIVKKLQSLAKSGKIKEDEIKSLAQKIESSREALIAASEYSDDLVQKALDKWQSTSKSGRIKVLRQAMEQTLEGQ